MILIGGLSVWSTVSVAANAIEILPFHPKIKLVHRNILRMADLKRRDSEIPAITLWMNEPFGIGTRNKAIYLQYVFQNFDV